MNNAGYTSMARVVLLLLLGLLGVARAQITVTPSNVTSDTSDQTLGAELGIGNSRTGTPNADGVFILVGITDNAIHHTEAQNIRGGILLAEPSTQLALSSDDIAVISCDPESYTANLGAGDVVETALVSQRATAVILYSTRQNSCNATGLPLDSVVYTLNSKQDAEILLSIVGDSARYGAIASRGTWSGASQSGSSSSQGSTNPGGPSPSTAVAMIILYSITGIITALFLVIIITGAVRAHRHPERYGPRNILGRPRQSRARGLARAMLETIPIVKFGDREAEQAAKSTDVELAEGGHGSVEVLPDQHASTNVSADTPGGTAAAESAATKEDGEGGIAPANSSDRAQPQAETQGCSICTDDFEVGQDQRVLPCNHRFHPDCVDPWLLNVSGTCPLCRIDLRPQDPTSPTDDVDEHGVAVRREGESTLSPPLENDTTRRLSIRRSLLVGLLGARPERMTREERLQALRQYREQQAARQRQQSEVATEDESSTRRRLRNVFHIRTRRTGADGQAQDVPEQ